MSGVAVIRYLLAQNEAVTEIVNVDQIMGGDLPMNAPLPAISVKEITSMPRLTIAMKEPHKLHTERVQVTVSVKGSDATAAGAGYPGVKALMKLILPACPNSRGTINSVDVDSIVPDLEGPDLFDDEYSIYSQSRDFIVSWRD